MNVKAKEVNERQTAWAPSTTPTAKPCESNNQVEGWVRPARYVTINKDNIHDLPEDVNQMLVTYGVGKASVSQSLKPA